MNAPLLTTGDLWVLLYVGLAVLVIALLIEAARNGLAGAMDRLDRQLRAWEAEDAATFGEPTREQVEADLEADVAWLAILAAVGVDSDEFRAAYAATPKTTRDA